MNRRHAANALVSLLILAACAGRPAPVTDGRAAVDPPRAEPSSGYRVPPAADDGWTTASVDSVRLDRRRLAQMTDAIREQQADWNFHAVLIERDGCLVYEEYFVGWDQRWGRSLGQVTFDRQTKHDLRSVSKSVVSALVGIAVGSGDIRSVLVIAALRVEAAEGEELPVHRLPAFEGLTGEEGATVAALLLRRRYRAGEVVIKEGNQNRSLFPIAKGTASVKIDLAGPNRSKRLATFSAGTVFGEVALLDKQPRSATVTADEELVCCELSKDGFDALTRAHPRIAIHLLMNLGGELSRRLRRSTATVSQLES